MKRLNGLALVLLLASPVVAQAQDDASRAPGAGKWGIGVVLGEPTGLTARFANDLQAHLAWSFAGEGSDAVALSMDYLFLRGPLGDPVGLGWYLGFGGRGKFGDEDFILGARLPVGLSYIFASPIEVFGEVVPVFNFVPSTDFDLQGAVGIRVLFGR